MAQEIRPEVPQSINLVGMKLNDRDDNFAGTIKAQLTRLGYCDARSCARDCHGPVVQFEWKDGRVRRECLFALISSNGYKLVK